MQVTKDKVVSFDYHLTNDEGEVLDSSQEGEPLAYLHGTGGIIPGLHDEMDGKSTGDEFEVRIAPADAYGEVDEELRQEIEKEQFGEIEDLAVGMQLQADSEEGHQMILTVMEIGDDVVTVDGNHPLAGVALNFKIKVTEVRDATPEELEHGHVHGPGGHQH